MTNHSRFSLLVLILAALLTFALPAAAQDAEPEPADIVNDEGGVEVIEGQLAYTDPDLPAYGSEPIIFLGNLGALFTDEFEFSLEYLDVDAPQTLGQITSDIFVSPFTFELRLPIDPGGPMYDVDNDGEDDPGVGVYSVNFTFNAIGDTFIDSREFIYFRSYQMSLDYETLYQINGGRLLFYADEDGQGVPAGFGDDGELFTEDDPIVTIPAGWTVVDLDTDPFTFIRSEVANVDVIESAGEELPDFSNLSYTEAFDSLIDLMENRYAFTEFKGVDWDAIREEYRPLIEEAEENNDSAAYQQALQDALYTIPDGHIFVGGPFLDAQPFPADIIGGLGIAVRELSDGSVIVNYVLPGSPADEAGVELGAEITEINGMSIDEAIEAEEGLNPPYSSPTLLRLEQLRGVVRFEVGEEVELTFQNPDADEAETVTLTAVDEQESRIVSRDSVYGAFTGAELPVEFEILPSGYGYIAIYTFSDDNALTIDLWERAMATMRLAGVPGLIIDMRYNNGGSPDISNPMLGYLFDEEVYTGTSAFYFPDVDEFRFDPLYDNVIEPASPDLYYGGPIAVLISPSCFSNCEFFSYALTLRDNTEIIGHYPTGGLGGGVEPFAMPDGVYGQFTVGRAVGADDEIHIEGSGVEPTLTVPVTAETVFSEGDPLLDAAVEWLDSASSADVLDGGEIVLGEAVTGSLDVNQRAEYTLTPDEDVTVVVTVGDETGQFDTVVAVYSEDGALLAENDDAPTGDTFNSLISELDLTGGETVIIEVGTFADTGAGEYILQVEEAP